MNAKIMMVFDCEEYEFGTYPYETAEQKQRVCEIAGKVSKERDCYTYVKEVE